MTTTPSDESMEERLNHEALEYVVNEVNPWALLYGSKVDHKLWAETYATFARRVLERAKGEMRSFAEFVWDYALNDAGSEVERLSKRPHREYLIERLLSDWKKYPRSSANEWR